jgi:predicted alpha/beta superfamily hydrolase
LLCAALFAFVAGCGETSAEKLTAATPDGKSATAPLSKAVASVLGGQRGEGQPYEIVGSEVWDVPDPVSERNYQVFIALPRSYADSPGRSYPVLYVTDADYAFPLIRQIGRRLNGDGPRIDEFILVGLSYATGEEGMPSRRRDYTPTPAGAYGSPPDAIHGDGDAYMAYLRDQVLPFVARRYRTDETRRYFLGHSYGGLLGTQIMFTQPELFSGYILGSPSYWYDNHYMHGMESAFASTHKDLPARVYMYVGQYEEIRPGDPRYARRYNMVTDARRMARALRSRNYPSLHMALDVLEDEDHLSVAPGGFTRGLKYLLSADVR